MADLNKRVQAVNSFPSNVIVLPIPSASEVSAAINTTGLRGLAVACEGPNGLVLGIDVYIPGLDEYMPLKNAEGDLIQIAVNGPPGVYVFPAEAWGAGAFSNIRLRIDSEHTGPNTLFVTELI